MKSFFKVMVFISSITASLANEAQNGYAVVKNDTIYGNIKINFAGGSVIVKQDSINRMFLTDIEVITLLNESRDTYYPYKIEDKTKFYKAIVAGENPLIER